MPPLKRKREDLQIKAKATEQMKLGFVQSIPKERKVSINYGLSH